MGPVIGGEKIQSASVSQGRQQNGNVAMLLLRGEKKTRDSTRIAEEDKRM